MDVNKFQFGRDSFIGNLEISRFSKRQSLTPSLLVFSENSKTRKSHIDIRYLLSRAESILLKKNPHNLPSSTSTLLNLSKAFTIVQDLPTARNFKICTRWGVHEKLHDWETSFLTVAKWLSHFEQFQQLPIEFRMKFLSGIWHLWVTFDKLSMNYLARQRGITDERVFLAGKDVYVDSNNIKLDFSWMTDYEKDSLTLFTDTIDWNMLTFIKPLLELNPNHVELTFMISQLCFNYAGLRFQSPILEISERFQEILANDLHNYYINHEKLPRYSARLAQLMKFVRTIEENFRDKKWKVEVGETFGVWKLDFSHPEVFKDNFC